MTCRFINEERRGALSARRAQIVPVNGCIAAMEKAVSALTCCVLALLSAFSCGVKPVVADDSPVFHQCLKGSDDPVAARNSKAACAAYLRRIMAGVRFG